MAWTVSLSDFLSASTALLLSHLQCSMTILIDSGGIPSSLTYSLFSTGFCSYFSSTYFVLKYMIFKLHLLSKIICFLFTNLTSWIMDFGFSKYNVWVINICWFEDFWVFDIEKELFSSFNCNSCNSSYWFHS